MKFVFLALVSLSVLSAQAQYNEPTSTSEPRKAPRVGEISYEDQERVRTRVETLDLTSLSFGPGWASELNNENTFYSIQLARHWEVNPNAEIRLSGHAAIPSRQGGAWLSGMIGAGYLFSVEDVSPIAGLEFGYAYGNVRHGPDAKGFAVGAFAGVRIFRTAKAQLSLEGFVQSIMDNSNPTMGGFRVGLLF
ncbi:MAG: hypothetical protein K2Q26_12920 [Bdellovibrionales bacterium]|nr:hypothetical protein [Bdellovibrionales bacterium]